MGIPMKSFVANFVGTFVEFQPFSTKMATKFPTKDMMGQAGNKQTHHVF